MLNKKFLYLKKTTEWKRVLFLYRRISKKYILLRAKGFNFRNLQRCKKKGRFKIRIWRKLYLYRLSRLQKFIKVL